MDLNSINPRRWYTRVWGKVIIILGFFVALFFGMVLFTTIRYWCQLRNGLKPAFIQERYSQYTALKTSVAAAKLVDRRQLETSDDPFLGRINAPVVIVAFWDYKCPNCRQAAPILKRVAERYGYGVKVIIRDFPPETLHPGATFLAQVAECAGRQGRYWQMYDVLFSQQDFLPEVLSATDLEQLA